MLEAVHDKGPLVSIVIPVYNAEKSLKNCLESVLAQDAQDIEVILVDDGSHDRSPEICTEYKDRNPEKIKYVRQKNGGPSAARNKGIELSRGKYIAFIDSDDMVASNMISAMAGTAEAEDAEMVICAYWKVTREERKIKTYSLPEGLYAGEDQNKVLYSLLDEDLGDVPPYSWVRLTKKSFFENSGLHFSERLYRSEDYHFWVKVHSMIGRVYLLSQTPLYNYFENESSVTHNHVNGYWEDVLFIYSDLQKSLNNDTAVSNKLDIMLVKRSLIALNNATFCKNIKDAYREIMQVVKNKELNRIIRTLDLAGAARFTRYRFLMSKGLKGVIAVKYLLRWFKCHK